MDLEEDFSLNLTYGLEAVSRAPSRVKAGRAERLAGRGGRGRGDSRPDGGLELRRPLSSRLREEISTGTKNEPEFEITGQVANDMMTKAEDVEPCPEKMIQERVAPSEKVVSSLHQCPQEASAPDAAQLIEEAVVTEATNEVELAPAASKVKRKRMTPTLEEDPHQFHSKPRDLGEHAGSLPADTGSSRQLASSHIFSRTPFSALPLPARLAATLERPPNEGGMNLQTSTRVQSVVVPLLHNGGNLLMKSQTGSGKTLAYLLPILSDLMGGGAVSRGDGTRALIISPTRELSVQITDTLGLLTRCCVWVVCGSVSGGEKKKSEKARLRKGVTVLVATPGRLLDHAKTTESFRLNQLRWVVLDEADRLLDMGFEQTILELLSIIRGAKLPGLKDKPGADGAVLTTLDQKWRAQAVQALKTCSNVDGLFHIMASATLTKGVRELALPVMGGSSFFFVDADAETVNTVNTAADLLAVERQRECAKRGRAGGQLVGGVVCFMDEEETAEPVESSKRSRSTGLEEGESMLAPSQLKQYYMLVSCKWRLAALVSFLRSYAHLKVVVFFSTCDSVDFHGLLFRGARWPEDLDAAHEEQNVQKKTQILDPLPHKFTGLFGDKCNMYRLHGNVPQKIRQEVYRDFCVASSGVLLCTDVAARGLDLPRVDWILQYDPPCETVSAHPS
jgi:superfamily II DNA/RNA helicase